MSLRGDVSEPLDPIFAVVCFSFLSQPRRARSRDLIDFAGWHRHPGSGRYPGEGNGDPLKYSCLENPMDGEAWRTTVHGSQRVRLSDFLFTFK